MKLTKLKTEQPFQRLKCGCLVRCCEEGGGEWIEHKKCTTVESKCVIDEYVAKHRTCLLCGRCLTCFKHTECNDLVSIGIKMVSWVSSYIIFPIYDFIDYIKYKLKGKK